MKAQVYDISSHSVDESEEGGSSDSFNFGSPKCRFILIALAVGAMLLASCSKLAEAQVIHNTQEPESTQVSPAPSQPASKTPETPILTASSTATAASTATARNTATEASTQTSVPSETPYPYEGSYPGMGQKFLREWESWKKGISGPIVDEIPDGTYMQTERHTASMLLLHEALRRGMVPDFTDLERGIALVCYNPAGGTVTISPAQMAEFERQGVVIWFGAGDADEAGIPRFQTESQMVGITEEPDSHVQSLLIGGSDEDLTNNLDYLSPFDAFHETHPPQSVTIDMSTINAIYIIPLHKETIREFMKRNGITENGIHKGLYTAVSNPTIIRGNKAMYKFFGW